MTREYVKYFFTGYRTAQMSPQFLSLLGAVRFALLYIIGVLAQQLADQFARGNYALDFQTLVGYVMPAVSVVLYGVWKYVRESQNPFVTTIPVIPPSPSPSIVPLQPKESPPKTG